MDLAIVFVAGLFAGVVNTLAGGGSLVTLPILIFIGLPSAVANGTNRIAIWIQCFSAVMGFQKRGVSHFRESIILSLPAIVGAVIGAQYSIELSDEGFKRILAVVMLVVIGLVVWNPSPHENPQQGRSGWKRVGLPLVFFGIGFYGGFIQAGVGYLITSALVLIRGFNLVQTAAVKSFIVAVYTTFAVGVFVFNGQVDWRIALALSMGNAIGAWVGSHLAIQKGEDFIRGLLLVTVVAMALKLFGLLPF